MPRCHVIAVAVPFIIGLLFTTASIVTFADTALFVSTAVRTDATFIGSVAKSGGNGGGTFLYPRFRFKAGNGQVITMTSSTGSTDQPYDDGQKVPVLYDPSHPERAKLDTFVIWIVPLCLAPFGLMFTLIPAVVFCFTRRAR